MLTTTLRRWTPPVALLAIVAVPACGASSSPSADASGNADASASCIGQPQTVRFGRCTDAVSGAPCDGRQETAAFTDLSAGESLPMVTGPQGADMFVISLRVDGIFPGDVGTGAGAPYVDLFVGAGAEQVSGFTTFRPFLADGDGFVSHGLFLALFVDGDALIGSTLDARVQIRDRDDVVRCGEIAFVAGDRV